MTPADTLRTGDVLTCRVDTLAYGGDGVARVDGRVLFLPGTAPGDTVRARVTQLKPRFARGRVEAVLAPGPGRAAPCCRAPDPDTGELVRVPGCVYDHLDYAAELRAKQEQLAGFLSRLPTDAGALALPPHPAPAPLHYRNKIVLHSARDRRGLRLGYRLEPSHRILDLAACPLACDAINAALAALRAPGRLDALPPGADLTLRHTAHDGVVAWAGRGTPLTAAALPDTLTEASPAGPLRVPRDGFFQVNPAVGDALVREVAAWFLAGDARQELLDLYCGVGVFGLACRQAAGGGRLVGVESGRAAVRAAARNAAALGVEAEFHCLALGRGRPDLGAWLRAPARATALLDPPRDGLAPAVTLALAESGIARLIYVSCDPATLARDLAALLAPGRYRLARARLFDLFPRTAHFETAVELLRA